MRNVAEKIVDRAIVSTPENPPPAMTIVTVPVGARGPPRPPHAPGMRSPSCEDQRVMDRLHAMSVLAQAGRKSRLGTGRNQQVIELIVRVWRSRP